MSTIQNSLSTRDRESLLALFFNMLPLFLHIRHHHSRNTEIILLQNTKQVDTCTLKPKNPSHTKEIFAAGSVQNRI